MQRFFNSALTALAIFLIIPAGAILASWNAVPGDSLYPVKTGLENLATKAFAGTEIERRLEIQFTERRFNEAIKLVGTKRDTAGLAYLIAQAEETKEKIIQAEDETAKVLLVQKLETYQEEIRKTKEDVATGAQLAVVEAPTATEIVTVTEFVPVPVPVPAPQPAPAPAPVPQPAPPPAPSGSQPAPPPPAPQPVSQAQSRPTPAPTVCVQVMTPARNNATGECKDFPTPCDVPTGWTKVSFCAKEPVATPKPTPTPAPQQPERPTQTPAPTPAPDHKSTEIVQDLYAAEIQIAVILDEIRRGHGRDRDNKEENKRDKDRNSGSGRPGRRRDN